MYRIEHRDIDPRTIRANVTDWPLDMSKVRAITDAMRHHGYDGPRVVVTSDLVHLDGQHRVTAAIAAGLATLPAIVLHGPQHHRQAGWEEYVLDQPDGHTFTNHDVWAWPYREYGAMTPEEIADIHEIPVPLARVVQGIITGAGWEFACEDDHLLVWPQDDRTEDVMEVWPEVRSPRVICRHPELSFWTYGFVPVDGAIITELEAAWDEVIP